MTLDELIAQHDKAAKASHEAARKLSTAKYAITQWAGDQLKAALAARGITPGKSVVLMKVRRTRKGRILLEQAEVVFHHIGRVTPPTMEKGALGPNAWSSEMHWSAQVYWRNVKKNGDPGLLGDWCLIQGDTVEEMADTILHVRELNNADPD